MVAVLLVEQLPVEPRLVVPYQVEHRGHQPALLRRVLPEHRPPHCRHPPEPRSQQDRQASAACTKQRRR